MIPKSRSALLVFALALAPRGAPAQAPAPAAEPAPREPLLRLETDGPSTLVTALAFRPDGRVLYEAGWDKVVRAWKLDEKSGKFLLDPRATLRVPIGPGLGGAINAMALSDDGRWLAVAGNGVVPGLSGFGQTGLVVPRGVLSDDDRRAQGAIFVFDMQAAPARCRVLRGHLGAVYALAFVPGDPKTLASAGAELDGRGVVRLWDVRDGSYVGGGFGPRVNARPGLAAWRFGPGRDEVRVAATWGDGSFRVLDFSRTAAPPAPVADAPANRVVVHLADRGQVVTGSFDGQAERGQLRFWDEAQARGGRAAPVFTLPLTTEGLGEGFGAWCVPQSAVTISSRPGGPPDGLAVVVQELAKGAPGPSGYGLLVVDLDPRRPPSVKARVPLWRGAKTQPVVAAVAGGRHLAVSGNQDRVIAVYAAADLLRGRAVAQRLRNSGADLGDVTFVRKGDARGLLLSGRPRDRPDAPHRPPEAADRVFDVTNGRLTDDAGGWEPATAGTAGWSLTAVPGRANPQGVKAPDRVVVRGGAGPERTIALATGEEVTAVALIPPGGAGRPGAAVAVALTEPGVGPSLWLYDAETGARVRQLSGHAGRVRGLSVSADGRRLASASEDQTVAVWNVHDLGDVVGRRGELTGLTLKAEAGRYRVAAVEPVSPYRRDDVLREGDTLLGLVEGGRVRVPATAGEFYLAVSRVRPGESVTVRRSRPGAAEADVTVRLGQAADERKPLFSLFLTDGPGARGWLGWSPLGPYESSGPDTERLFGWHFNTGQAAEPVRFALATEYRAFRTEGVLKHLYERGTLPPPPAPPPVAAPALSLLIDPAAEPDGRGQILLRRPPSGVSLVAADRIPADAQVEAVTFRVDGQPPRTMAAVSRGIWTADLSGITWGRGTHLITTTLRTREASPQTFETSQVVRVQPPAAAVRSELGGKTLDVDAPGFTFRATVEPAEGVPATVRLIGFGEKGPVVSKTWEAAKRLAIEEVVALPPGLTTFTVEAVNRDALKGDEAFETRRLAPVSVYFHKPPTLPPVVALTGVVPLDGRGNDAGPRRDVSADAVTVVGVPGVRVEGQITAKDAIEAAERGAGGDGPWAGLAGFQSGRAAAFGVREVLKLAPGRQTVRFRARSADSPWREASLTLEYRPPAPELAEIEFEPPGPVVVGPASSAPPRVRLRARLLGMEAGAALDEAVVVVNGEPLPDLPAVDRGAEALAAAFPLRPGANTVEIRLRNRWGSARTVGPRTVTWRRPPRVLAVDCPPPGKRPFLDVNARVETATPLTAAELVLETRGDDGEVKSRSVALTVTAAGDAWTASARGVALEPGETAVRVWASNADGRSTEPGTGGRFLVRRPVPPPVVELLSPALDAKVDRAKIRLKYRVRSATPVTAVRVVRATPGSGRETLDEADLAPAASRAPGPFDLTAGSSVVLNRDVNSLQVIAVNDGGEGSARVDVTLVPPPVQVVIDRFETGRAGLPAVDTVAETESGRLAAAAPLPDGRVRVRGRLIYLDDAALAGAGRAEIQFWVNGFPQVMAAVTPRPGRSLETEFASDLLLGRTTNQVEVRLSGPARESSDRTTVTVACLEPVRDQRLHLLVLGVGPSGEVEMKDRALRAVHGRPAAEVEDEFETPAFARGWIYGPLCGRQVRKGRLMTEICRVRKALVLGSRPSNDVVVLYYRGGEMIAGPGKPLALRLGAGHTERDSVRLDEIVDLLSEARGAKLFLLDVSRHDDKSPVPIEAVRPWPSGDSRYGLMRFRWEDRGGDGPPPPADPEEARLITAFQNAMPGAVTLREVATRLSQTAGTLQSRYPNLTYDQILSDDLADLIVGGPTQ